MRPDGNGFGAIAVVDGAAHFGDTWFPGNEVGGSFDFVGNRAAFDEPPEGEGGVELVVEWNE